MGPNNTKHRKLDKVAGDRKVLLVSEDDDGIWVDLADGYNFEGCSGIRGDSVGDVLKQFARVEAGSPY